MSMQALDTSERRRHPRQRAAGDSVLFAEKYGFGTAADVKNVSPGGMMVTTLRPIRGGGEDFFVLLFGEGADDLVCRRARIAWQSTSDDETNYVGFEFLQAPSDELSTWIRKASVSQ